MTAHKHQDNATGEKVKTYSKWLENALNLRLYVKHYDQRYRVEVAFGGLAWKIFYGPYLFAIYEFEGQQLHLLDRPNWVHRVNIRSAVKSVENTRDFR